MVKNISKTYGQITNELMKKTDHQEIGETWNEMSKNWVKMVNEAIEKGKKSELKTFYIHIFVKKDPNCHQSIRIFPFVRRTRPKPDSGVDHYLYMWDENKGLSFEWGIPRPEIVKYVLENPNKFDSQMVRNMRAFKKGNLE